MAHSQTMPVIDLGAERRARLAAARLYLVCPPTHEMSTGGLDLPELLRGAVAGGVDIVQLRDKHLGDDELVAVANAARALCERLGVLLIVNDRPLVAREAGADGVHVGQEDMTVADARRLLGPGAIIGLSIKTVAQASAAPLDLIDYAGIGGVYGTTSKSNTSKPIGPEGLKRIIEEFHRRKPAFLTCGIAGINESNATEVIAAGVDGISVISALSLAPDPQGAARRLREIVDTALAKRGRA